MAPVNPEVHAALRQDPHPRGSDAIVLHTLQLLCDKGEPPGPLIDVALLLYRRSNLVRCLLQLHVMVYGLPDQR